MLNFPSDSTISQGKICHLSLLSLLLTLTLLYFTERSAKQPSVLSQYSKFKQIQFSRYKFNSQSALCCYLDVVKPIIRNYMPISGKNVFVML